MTLNLWCFRWGRPQHPYSLPLLCVADMIPFPGEKRLCNTEILSTVCWLIFAARVRRNNPPSRLLHGCTAGSSLSSSWLRTSYASTGFLSLSKVSESCGLPVRIKSSAPSKLQSLCSVPPPQATVSKGMRQELMDQRLAVACCQGQASSFAARHSWASASAARAWESPLLSRELQHQGL